MIWATIHTCFHALPPDRQALDDAERVFRRRADRAFRDQRADAELFPPPDPTADDGG